MEVKRALEILTNSEVRNTVSMKDIEDAITTFSKEVVAPIQKDLSEVKDAITAQLAGEGAKDGETREILGNTVKFSVKKSHKVMKDEAYDLIDRMEPGLVKREPTIHWQHLKKFMTNCNEKSRQRLIDEGFISEIVTHDIKFI